MMPKVIGNDSLIARVNEVQGCMYRQSNELGRLNKAVRKYKEENAKLRELCADMWFWSYEGHIDSESQERQMLHIDAVIQRMRELGVVVEYDKD